jgi:hypothetical protein
MISWGEIDTAEMELIDLIYFIPILAIIIISPLDDIFPQINADSARYLLSSLVQSEAAIIAIVVSLSIVAVQINATSSYSTKVIDIFRNSNYLWGLIWIYLVSIVYTLFVLMQIQEKNNAHLNAEIYLSYFFGILSFTALIPYILKIFDLLKPTYIIDILSEGITMESILSINKPSDVSDSTQPVIDIIIGAINRFDEGTIVAGLNAIESKVEGIFRSNDLKDPELQLKFAEPVLFNISIITMIAANKKDEIATKQIIETVERMNIEAEELELDVIASKIAKNLGSIGECCVRNKLEFAGSIAAKSLSTVGVKSVEKKLHSTAISAVSALESFYNWAEEAKIASTKAFVISARSAILAKNNDNKFFEEIFEAELEKAADQDNIMALLEIFACYNMLGLKAQREAVRDQLQVLGFDMQSRS